MEKNNKKTNKYQYALPIEPITLPILNSHNPISWISWLYAYIIQTNYLSKKILVEINESKQILICDDTSMKYLWTHGFFGTGQLSRSEPTWYERTLNRLNLQTEDSKKLEILTSSRRKQRLEFKKKRAEFEQRKLQLRHQGITDSKLLDREKKLLRSLRDKELKIESNINDFKYSNYDKLLITNNGGDILRLEKMELMPVEAIFLTFALPVLDIKISQLMNILVGDSPEYQDIDSLIKKYVVYHHYRSRGWCVKSGIKFGCDYLLYKKGPPFHHAEFSIMVLDSDVQQDYTWYSNVSRVVGSARKQLVLSYVIRLTSTHHIMNLWKKQKFEQVFSQYKIGEITYRRWVPGKHRD